MSRIVAVQIICITALFIGLTLFDRDKTACPIPREVAEGITGQDGCLPLCPSIVTTLPCNLLVDMCRVILLHGGGGQPPSKIYCTLEECDGVIGCTGNDNQQICQGAGPLDVADVLHCTYKPMTCGKKIVSIESCDLHAPEDPEDYEGYFCACENTIITNQDCHVETFDQSEACIPNGKA